MEEATAARVCVWGLGTGALLFSWAWAWSAKQMIPCGNPRFPPPPWLPWHSMKLFEFCLIFHSESMKCFALYTIKRELENQF